MVDNKNDRDVHGHSSLSSAPEDKKTNWLPLLLGALLLLGLLFLLLRGCDDEEQVVTPTETETPVATTTAATTGATAATTAVAVPVTYTREALDRTLGGTDPLPAVYSLDRVTFALGSAELSADAQAELADVAEALKARETARISLKGHADPSGPTELNEKLSADRAAAVRAALVDAGVDAGRIDTSGLGETGEMVAPRNRRVEITLLSR